ncbi:hypothetical protein [Pantoea sp. SORGH_AS_0659]|uniref:hypothetical protein n=1 Tax=Pantoea sp. SORGH_AS_0659 TaxID=3062597 RepID=UPI00285B012A|nr:hypothetical protein [Pantoea sp. SORGH_AS_0659]MDR6350870.1 hypothetical protein [Pantoea sp. SORGH_AS_0659]
MRERGIIFNAEMVRAVLEGRKTQTRRIMKVQPESNQLGLLRITASTNRSDTGKYHWAESNATGNHVRSKLFACPFGAVGDRLWVREAFRVHSRPTDVATLVYKSSEKQSWTHQTHRVPIEKCNKPAVVDKWTPSIHMPRWASRITLEITGVRVERLWDITEDDAKAEGCTFEALRFQPGTREVEEMGHTAVYQFGGLWQSIYGEESWQANPWVWVIEFKRVEGDA